MSYPRGFLAVLRHELGSGWLAPVGLALVIAGMGAKLHSGTIQLMASDMPKLGAWLLIALVGGPLAARRLLVEREAGSFLATRPVSRFGALAAKALAAGLDLALVCVAGAVFISGAEEASPVSSMDGTRNEMLPLVGLVAIVAITFSSFSTIRSAWIAGTVSICLPLVTLTAIIVSEPLGWVMVLLPMGCAAIWGSAWKGAER